MNTPRLLALFLLAILAQGASATTIWLKDRNGQVCTNTASGNAGGVIGLASVDRNGVVTMKIDNPDTGVETRNPSTGDCAGLPRTGATGGTPLVFAGNVSARIVPVHMLKPGTKGAMECLDQGSSFAGVSTGASPLVSGKFKLEFGFLYTDGCGSANNGLPTFSRSANLRDENNPENQIIVFNGLYHIFNESNPVPEPGSLALLVAGAAGLLMLAWGRRRSLAQSQR